MINNLEDIKEFAGRPLDVWALGVTTFVLTYKDLPIKPTNPGNILELIDLISEAK